MKSRTTWNDRYRSFNAFLLLTISLFYFLITPNQVTFHEFLHDHQSENCSAEIESDPCHQTIYHNKFIDGCNHQSHFHKPKIQCDLCINLIINPDFISTDSECKQFGQSFHQKFVNQSEDWYTKEFPANQNRGPPFNICG